jgi:hypothetical protein
MWIALSISDISLWLAITAVILLVTSELLYSLPDLNGRLTIDKNRFRVTALGCGVGFLVTVLIHGLGIII